MKAVLGLLMTTLFFGSIASAKKVDVLVCSIGQSYSFKYYVGTDVIDLWEMAGVMGRPIAEDKIVKIDQGSGTLRITTKKFGVVNLDFNNIYKEGRGTWNHGGVLNGLLADEPDYNVNGVAEAESCYYDTYY